MISDMVGCAMDGVSCHMSLMMPGTAAPYHQALGAGDIRTLYHATDVNGANSILENGIDLSRGRLNLDFNPSSQPGFYLTADLNQAQLWAAKRFGGKGTVLEYNVPVSELKVLNGRIFNQADEDWTNFVFAGRNGQLIHNYDYVEGPYLSLATGKGVGHQLALFTSQATELFNAHLRREYGLD